MFPGAPGNPAGTVEIARRALGRLRGAAVASAFALVSTFLLSFSCTGFRFWFRRAFCGDKPPRPIPDFLQQKLVEAHAKYHKDGPKETCAADVNLTDDDEALDWMAEYMNEAHENGRSHGANGKWVPSCGWQSTHYRKSAPETTASAVLWGQPCSWGAVLLPEHWRRFQARADALRRASRLPELRCPEGKDARTCRVVANRWGRNSWKRLLILHMVEQGLVMAYPNLPQRTAFSTNHVEPGLHNVNLQALAGQRARHRMPLVDARFCAAQGLRCRAGLGPAGAPARGTTQRQQATAADARHRCAAAPSGRDEPPPSLASPTAPPCSARPQAPRPGTPPSAAPPGSTTRAPASSESAAGASLNFLQAVRYASRIRPV